eukprot:2676260-Pleurochrysis_carterae.AAC.2
MLYARVASTSDMQDRMANFMPGQSAKCCGWLTCTCVRVRPTCDAKLKVFLAHAPTVCRRRASEGC